MGNSSLESYPEGSTEEDQQYLVDLWAVLLVLVSQKKTRGKTSNTNLTEENNVSILLWISPFLTIIHTSTE